jgi:RNA 2',3'-cyclic 3'-phosphodiesterase
MSRMFVALQPSSEAVEHLDAFLDVRREAGPGLRWTQPDQLHLTLAFLAEVPERRLDDLAERLERAAAKRTAFEARVAAGGAFPHVADARVLWAGLEVDEAGRAELDRLATGARAAANRAGIAVDGQRFRPHLTLARTRFPHDVSRWVRLLDGYAGPAFEVSEVALVESHLGEGPRGRPRHVTAASFALGRA